MAVVANPDLDSISAFTKSGDIVTATISFTATYAPSYVTNTNTYAVGKNIYISGSETAANDGEYTITAVNVAGSTGSISYTNASGVAQASQFALASPVDLAITKDLVDPLTLTAAKPFSYSFTSFTGWNPPPTSGSPLPIITDAASSNTVGSTNHLETTISAIE
jgi:hypothetical protein